jgi:sec-independent protein translocase protein TatB
MVSPPPIELGSLGMADSLILMVLALVVFGPRRLPQIGRQIGKLMYEFRKASNDFKFQMEEELRLSEDADRRKKEEAERARNLALNPPAPAIEAQAGIGADEQASVSAPAGMYSGDAVTPDAADITGEPATEPAAESATPSEESRIRYPRINPPATGDPVPAARPGAAMVPPEPAPDGGINAEANIGTAPSEVVAPSEVIAPSEVVGSSDETAAVEDAAVTEPSVALPRTPQSGPSSEPKPTEKVSQHG